MFRLRSVSSLVTPSLSVRKPTRILRLHAELVYTGQCRPLSKTVRFNVLRVSKSKASAKSFGKF